ncbi:hypothetical protein Tco_0636730 [Tanacetum coccineum]
MTRSSTNKLFTPYKDPEREFRSSMRHFKTLSLDELRSPDFNLLSDQEYSEEEEAEAMTETMEQYMSKTRTDYGSGVARPKIDNKDQFELKGQFLKELRENTFSGSDNEDANEHIEKVLEIVDLFHVPNITVDQLMLRVFPISLTGATSRWLRNEPTGLIKTWEDLKTMFLNKYCPPGQTAKKMEEINNFQQEPDDTLYQAWERFKELLMKCPQHYLTEMQEVILFYNGLDVPTRQILDSRGAVPTKTADEREKTYDQITEAYGVHFINNTTRQEKDPEEFHLPCVIMICFDNALVDLGANVSVMPLLTYLNLGLGELAHTKITVELADRTVKYPKGITEKPCSSEKTIFVYRARAKINVYKRKITLRVGEEKIIFKSVKPASSIIKRVYMLSLRERMELDLEARLIDERTFIVEVDSIRPSWKITLKLMTLNEPFKR